MASLRNLVLQPDNLRLLSALLAQLGYEVRKVINKQTALKTAQAAPPDLILLDVMMMSDMNGYEVCQHLKASPRTCDIPVIFISALDEVLDKVKAFAVGELIILQSLLVKKFLRG